jgi:hypothetical protein
MKEKETRTEGSVSECEEVNEMKESMRVESSNAGSVRVE